MRRCYLEPVGHSDGVCPNAAEYVARLNWTAGPMLLCRDHAAIERAHDDVVTIRTLRDED